MRTFIGLALVSLSLYLPTSLAQQLAPGKYTGRMEFTSPAGKPINETVTLTIEKVDGDRVEGIAWVGTRLCSVDTPFAGRLEGDTLKLRGAPLKEKCGVNWDLKVAGDKLEGTTASGYAVRLSR